MTDRRMSSARYRSAVAVLTGLLAVLVLSSGVLPVGDAVARETAPVGVSGSTFSPTKATARVGEGVPVDIPSSWGEWIADVERPAEGYRGRYQLSPVGG